MSLISEILHIKFASAREGGAKWPRARRRQMALVGFMQAGNATVYAGSWRHPATEHGFLTAGYYEKLGRTLETGLLRPDVLRRPTGHARHLRRIGGRGGAHRRPPREARPEHRARDRGRRHQDISASGATYSTTYYSPFHVARTFATLDHLSGGRAAWNVVTSVNDGEAQNFGLKEHLPTTRATTAPTSSSRRRPGCGTVGTTTRWCSTARRRSSPTPTRCTSSTTRGSGSTCAAR